MPLAEGSTFAGFTIVRQLGSGGMGEVYLARHPRLPRQDALKVLRADVSADGEYRARFNREADAAASLWHPHIVAVHDRGEFDGQLWIDMDFVDGTDTVSLLRDRYPNGMPGPEVTEIITAVAEALDYAHERRLLHRDVKPANILIANPDSPDRRIMLADFGIAGWVDDPSGLTATNMTVGTVSYAAPEQLMGNELDGRADQYALAATAFHLLTGSPPFQHANPAVVISQHLSASPPAIGDRVPELTPLDPVFAKALAKQPKDRYQRCVDFARALGHRLGGAGDPDDGLVLPSPSWWRWRAAWVSRLPIRGGHLDPARRHRRHRRPQMRSSSAFSTTVSLWVARWRRQRSTFSTNPSVHPAAVSSGRMRAISIPRWPTSSWRCATTCSTSSTTSRTARTIRRERWPPRTV